MDELSLMDKMRIIQEIVPGKQITLAHIIANPDRILYKKLGLDPAVDYAKSAIGIVTMSRRKLPSSPATSPLKAAGWSWGLWTVFPAP